MHKTALIALLFLTVSLSACRHDSALSGQHVEYSVAGGVNDSDASTQQNGNYQGQRNGSHTDGLSSAESNILSLKEQKGIVEVVLDPNGTGPYTGTPQAIAGQKVKTKFSLTEQTELKFTLLQIFKATIRGSGEGVLEILVSVHNDDGSGQIVMGSISTVHYSLKEDPDNEDEIILTRSGPQGATDTSVMNDGGEFVDISPEPAPFTLPAGDYFALMETNVKAGGDVDYIYLDAESDFDLVEVR